jgi:hypothetical protein
LLNGADLRVGAVLRCAPGLTIAEVDGSADGRGWLRGVIFRHALQTLYAYRLRARVLSGLIPRHIAIVMDGNRRWARQQGMSNVSLGHQYGAEADPQVGVGESHVGADQEQTLQLVQRRGHVRGVPPDSSPTTPPGYTPKST